MFFNGGGGGGFPFGGSGFGKFIINEETFFYNIVKRSLWVQVVHTVVSKKK